MWGVAGKLWRPPFSRLEKKTPTKKLKIRGSYKNWFTPLLWVPIDVVVKKHGNLTNALLYLQVLATRYLLLKVSSTLSYSFQLWLQVKKRSYLPLRARRTVGQPLYGTTMQPLIQSSMQKRVPKLLDPSSKIGFGVYIQWTRSFIKDPLTGVRVSTTIGRTKGLG